MSAAETIALRDFLRQDPRLEGVTFVASTEDAAGESPQELVPPPYALVFAGGGPDNQERLTGPHTAREPSWTIHCVGASALAAEIVSDWVDDVLRPRGRGVILSVPGRQTGRLRRTDVGPVLDDDSTAPVVWYVPVTYRFKSSPASETT